MFEPGLAGLLTALQPRLDAPAAVPDFDAIRRDGSAAGFAAGEAAQVAALAPLRANLGAAAAALDAACVIDADRLRPVFAALVTQVAEAVLLAELTAGAAVLLPLVRAALDHVAVGEARVLRAHPETLALMRGYLPDVVVAADAEMERDEFAVTAPGFVIAAALGARLADVVRGLA